MNLVERLLKQRLHCLLMDHAGLGNAARMRTRETVNGHVIADRPAAAHAPLIVAFNAGGRVIHRTEPISPGQGITRRPFVDEEIPPQPARLSTDRRGSGRNERLNQLDGGDRQEHNDESARKP